MGERWPGRAPPSVPNERKESARTSAAALRIARQTQTARRTPSWAKVCICGQRPVKDTDYVRRQLAHTLNAPGKFLIAAAEHDTPKRARAYLVTDQAVEATANRYADFRPRSMPSHDRRQKKISIPNEPWFYPRPTPRTPTRQTPRTPCCGWPWCSPRTREPPSPTS